MAFQDFGPHVNPFISGGHLGTFNSSTTANLFGIHALAFNPSTSFGIHPLSFTDFAHFGSHVHSPFAGVNPLGFADFLHSGSQMQPPFGNVNLEADLGGFSVGNGNSGQFGSENGSGVFTAGLTATPSTYTLTSADNGHTIKLAPDEIVSNSDGNFSVTLDFNSNDTLLLHPVSGTEKITIIDFNPSSGFDSSTHTGGENINLTDLGLSRGELLSPPTTTNNIPPGPIDWQVHKGSLTIDFGTYSPVNDILNSSDSPSGHGFIL